MDLNQRWVSPKNHVNNEISPVAFFAKVVLYKRRCEASGGKLKNAAGG